MSGSVLWLAPSRRARGGLARSVDALLAQRMLSRHVRHIATTPDATGGVGLKLAVAARALAELDRQLRRSSVAPLVHIHLEADASFYRKAVLAARARASGARVVVSVRGWRFGQFVRDERDTVEALFSRCSRVLVPSPWMHEQLAPYLPGDRMQILPPGVQVGAFQPAPQGREGPTVLFLGGSDPRKGGELLTQAARALPRDLKLRWLVAGGGDLGPLVKALRNARRGPVRRLGWLRGAALEQAYAASNLVLHPSHATAFPQVVLEAMAAGRPVLASARGGTADLLGAGEAGWLVDQQTPEAWGHRLAEVLAAPRRLAATGERGNRRAAALFDREIVATHLLATYSQVGHGRRTSMLLRLPFAARALGDNLLR